VNRDLFHLGVFLDKSTRKSPPQSPHIKGPVSKFDIIRSGAFRKFLNEVDFTRDTLDWLDDELREKQTFYPALRNKHSEKSQLSFYRICLDPKSTLSDEEILRGMRTLTANKISYGEAPSIFKHVIDEREAKKFLTDKKTLHTDVLQKMEAWGLLTIGLNSTYVSFLMQLIGFLERCDATLFEKIDEAHKRGLFFDITMRDTADCLYIRSIIKLLDENFETVIGAMEFNPHSLRFHSFEERSSMLQKIITDAQKTNI
jgi:hypothetical protein